MSDIFRGIPEDRADEIFNLGWALVFCALTNPVKFPNLPVKLLERGVSKLHNVNEQILLALSLGNLQSGLVVGTGILYPRFLTVATVIRKALPGVTVYDTEHIDTMVSALQQDTIFNKAVEKQVQSGNINLN